MNQQIKEIKQPCCQNSFKTIEDCDNCESCCHFCDEGLETPLYCFSCDKIQKQEKAPDYFRLFSLEPSFSIDQERLNEEYDKLIEALHPDFHVQGSSHDQSLSLDYTALINEAKNILEDPFLRGKYLLSLVHPDAATLPRELPQDFIMNMFMLQEALEELEGGNGTEEEHLRVTGEIDQLKNSLEQELEQKFSLLLQNLEQSDILSEIQYALAKLKFIVNLEEKLKEVAL